MPSDSQTDDLALRRHMYYLVHDIGPAIASFESVTYLIDTGGLDLNKASHRKLLEDTKASIGYAKLLIENLLEFSYLTREKILSSSKNIDWDVFLYEAVTLPTLLAQEKSIQISYEILQNGLTGFINPGVLKRIIHNIVINSIKYCPAGSTVKIELKKNIDRAELTIQDDGPGLPDTKLESMFDEAVQLDLRATGEFKGVGIGLAFCREATRYLNGNLTVKNILPHGLQFLLSLPVGGELQK